ncbi:hypothetical protein [Thioalkalivibrio sp.]|uniref:hypothetical protein n=1 Tax=Thioalkalivibrio sp. TaxID=2093813 RepID=UPI003563CF9E
MGNLTGVGSGREQIPHGAALERGEAYAALLDVYMREHPDAAQHPDFLPFFAGLGCMAEGWGRTQNLNPFKVAEIERAARPRLARKLADAHASQSAEPVLITFRANVTAGDYDMANGIFPITSGRSIESDIRPDDFCQTVARAKGPCPPRGICQQSLFPTHFRIAAADGARLAPPHVVDMLGGKVAIGHERARAFYERGFPTVVVEVTGRVRSVTLGEAGVGFVRLEPVRATLRTQGNDRYSQELAVLGPEQLGAFAAGTAGGAGAPGGTDAMMRFDRDVYLFQSAHRSAMPFVAYSAANLDASEVKALTGAITGAIGADPRFFERGGAREMAHHVTGIGHAVVAGNWRNKLNHALESDYSTADYSVIQIARATGAAATTETSGPPEAPLPSADFGPDKMPILRTWIPHYLENTSQPEQIEVLKGFIAQLHQAHDYAANTVFAEGEIEGRNAEFLAWSAHDRWLAALEEQSVEAPFNLSVQMQTRNLRYDFESGNLVLFSGHDDNELAMYRALRNGIIEAGGVGQSSRFLGIKPPRWPRIRVAGGKIPASFSMDAARAEEMIVNRDIVVFDVALRIASVDYVKTERGEHSLDLQAEILGVNVATDRGVQLAALAAEDMPQIAPEPVTDEAAPVNETVHLARPRDILAAIAKETEGDATDLIASVYPSTSQDAFDRRDEISDLAASARDIDLGGFWMSGYGKLADYDFNSREYGFDYVRLTYPDGVSRNEKGIRRHDLLRLENVAGRSGVRFAMPEAEAQRLRDMTRGADATFRARLAVQPPAVGTGASALPLTAELLELVVLRPGSDPQIVNDDEVVARIDLDASSNAQPDGGGVTPSGDGSAGGATADAYDILGVRVGQPMAAGLSQVGSEFATETILHGRRNIWIDANVSRTIEATTPLAESMILVREDARDFLAIFYEPLLSDDPITGIARTITFAEGSRPKPEAIRDLLVEKYGEIGYENASVYLWSRTRKTPIPKVQGEMSVGELIAQSTEEQNRKTQRWVCGKELESIAFALSDSITSSRRYGYPPFKTDYPLVDDAGEQVSHPEERPLWALELHRLEDVKCDTDVVMAAIQQDDSGLVAALRVLVTSRAYLATIKDAAEVTFLDRNAAKQTAPEIDF